MVIEHFTKIHSPTNIKVVPLDPNPNRKSELIKEFGVIFPYEGNDRLEEPNVDARKYFYGGKSVWTLKHIQK